MPQTLARNNGANKLTISGSQQLDVMPTEANSLTETSERDSQREPR